jgi:hypothetical protein
MEPQRNEVSIGVILAVMGLIIWYAVDSDSFTAWFHRTGENTGKVIEGMSSFFREQLEKWLGK